ncbi:MAG: hypothetical protein V3V66_02820, partial [Anaerolineales bacterium]
MDKETPENIQTFCQFRTNYHWSSTSDIKYEGLLIVILGLPRIKYLSHGYEKNFAGLHSNYFV